MKPVFYPVKQHLFGMLKPFKYDVYQAAKNFAIEYMTRKIEMKSSAFDVAVIKKYFPRLRYTELNNYCVTSISESGPLSPDRFNSVSDIIVYDKSLIVATVRFPGNNSKTIPILVLKTFADKRSVSALYKLREAIRHDTIKYRSSLDKTICFNHEYGGWQPNYSVKRRTFGDTFISASVRHKLFTGMDSFLNRRDWYEKHNLPYHYGILLYGPPGTGKSTIIQALANKYNLIPFIATKNIIESLSSIKDMSDNIDDEYMKRPKLLIIEDIDAFSFAADRDIDNIQTNALDKIRTSDNVDADDIICEVRERKRCRKDMSKFLNSLDGIGAAENIVYVFTTNNICAIDPAVKRAGRLDMILEIGYVTDETLDDFLMYHFNQHLPENLSVKPRQIFADIQLDVMQELSFDDILAKYTEKDSH